MLLGLLVAAVAILLVWSPWSPPVIRPDAPAVSGEAAEPLDLGPSSMSVPVRVDLARLLTQVEEHVPTEWGDLSRPVQLRGEGRAVTAIELARGPFEAVFTGRSARLSTVVAYRVQGTYDLPMLPDINFGCATGSDDVWPRLSVGLEAPVDLTENWRLATRTEILNIAPASGEDRDRCRVTAVDIDITDRVVGAARAFLEEHTESIDSIVGSADLRSSFESWWEVLGRPVRLDEEVWLDMRPETISRGRIEGRGQVVEIQASLGARPRVVLGSRPTSPPRPLPPLQQGAGDGPLEILVEAVGEYAEASRLLSDALVGLELQAGDQRIVVRGVRLRGIGGGRVALEALVDGSIEGTVFLVGTPRYDTDTGFASVPDLAFSVATSSVLVAGASWMLDGGVEALLRDRARWPVDPALEWASARLADGLNRSLADGVRLEGTVHDVSVVGIRATPTALVVGAAATADATLHVSAGG